MAGYEPAPVRSDARGGVDLDALREVIAEGDIAGLMLTNPNTLGLFDEHIAEIARLVHEAGGLLYYDGANANAVLGISRPGDMGFDIVHFNTHKTFSTPHGGGGPGAGPIVVRDSLAPFLPVPLVEKGGGRSLLLRVRPSPVHRQGAHVLRQLRRAGARLDVHPQPRRRRACARSARRPCSTPTT